MHRSTYCNITSSNIISYIQILTNPWDSTVPQVRPYVRHGTDTHFSILYSDITIRQHINYPSNRRDTPGVCPQESNWRFHQTSSSFRSDIKKEDISFDISSSKGAVTYSPDFSVPSARRGLTSLFGMGRGGTLVLWPPYFISFSARQLSAGVVR